MDEELNFYGEKIDKTYAKSEKLPRLRDLRLKHIREFIKAIKKKNEWESN